VTHYGPEPPWSGRGRYGSWRQGEELWDGSGFAWTWIPPASSMLVQVSEILKDFYITPMRKMLNEPLAFTRLLQAEQDVLRA